MFSFTDSLVAFVHLSRISKSRHQHKDEAEGNPEDCPSGLESFGTPSYLSGFGNISTTARCFLQHHSCHRDISDGFLWPFSRDAAQRINTNCKQVFHIYGQLKSASVYNWNFYILANDRFLKIVLKSHLHDNEPIFKLLMIQIYWTVVYNP